MSSNCPECGYEVESVTDLVTNGGGHADQSWHICPECGEESSIQHWVTEPKTVDTCEWDECRIKLKPFSTIVTSRGRYCSVFCVDADELTNND